MSLRDRSKSLARAALRPIWLVIWRRLEARIRTMAIATNLDEGSLRQHIPAFLNAISTVGAFGHELMRVRKETAAGLAALDARVTALRADLDSAGIGSLPLSPASPPRIVAPTKLAGMKSGLRLNLGCGDRPLDGYVNVDCRPLAGVDIVADAGSLPVDPGTVQEIRAAHLLEHLPPAELRRLLPYWFSLLAQGGTFTAIVPDAEAMLAHCVAGTYDFAQMRDLLFGSHGDVHLNMFTPPSLQALLEEVGFAETQVLAQGRRNERGYEFEINARRP